MADDEVLIIEQKLNQPLGLVSIPLVVSINPPILSINLSL